MQAPEAVTDNAAGAATRLALLQSTPALLRGRRCYIDEHPDDAAGAATEHAGLPLATRILRKPW